MRSPLRDCVSARVMNEGGRSAARRKTSSYVASRLFSEPHALQRSVSASSTASGRAFREALRNMLLRQPCSRQASLVSPGGAPCRPGSLLRKANGDAGRFPHSRRLMSAPSNGNGGWNLCARREAGIKFFVKAKKCLARN